MIPSNILSASVGHMEFRQTMGCFATGVAVVTTLDNGVPRGLTANSVTSVSLKPPLVLVCVDHTSESYNGFLSSKIFAINFLNVEQIDIARRFASKSANKFSDIQYHTGLTGAPLLPDVVAFIECALEAHYPAGDHTIFVGKVVACEVFGGREPLLFYRGKYSRIERMPMPITYLYGG